MHEYVILHSKKKKRKAILGVYLEKERLFQIIWIFKGEESLLVVVKTRCKDEDQSREEAKSQGMWVESVTGKGKETDSPPSGKILDDSKHSLKAGGVRRLGPARQETTFLILDVKEASQATHVQKGSLKVNKGRGRHPAVVHAASLWPPWRSPALLEDAGARSGGH